MNQQFSIEIVDPFDERMSLFREKVYSEDNGIDPQIAYERITHSQCKTRFPDKEWEEVFKFGQHKWENTHFDGITAAISQNNEIVSISGYKHYSSFLRTGMHLYTLKNWRKECRSILWSEKGFISKILEKVPTENLRGIFISIYPHSKTLAKWADRFAKKSNFGQLSQDDPSVVGRMKEFYPLDGFIEFNNTLQKFFFMPLNKTSFCPEKIKKELILAINEVKE